MDNSSLSANPALWHSIECALEQSEYLLLLASTESAQSDWVKRELDWWLTHRTASTILILVTDGELVWHSGDRDFDWNITTALNPRLKSVFAEEPLWVDLRWARRSQGKLSFRNSAFRNAVLQIAPPLYGKSREDLDDEDKRHYRNARRLALSTVFVLLLLAFGLTYASRVARQQQAVAECRQLAGESVGFLDTRLDLALLLGVDASRRAVCVDATSALLTALQHRQYLSGFLSGHTDAVTDLAYSHDGKLLASSGWDHRIRLWDMLKHKAVGPVLPGIYGLSFSPDNKLLAAADESAVNIWQMPSGAAIGKLSVDRKYELSRVSFSPDGRLLAAASEATGANPSRIFLWEVATSKLLNSSIEARSFAFSPNGKLLATEGEDGESIVLHDLSTQRTVGRPWRGLSSRVRSIAFSPNGRFLAAGGKEDSVFVWDLNSSQSSGQALVGHHAAVNSLAFSPDGSILASASGDGSVILWDAEHWQPLCEPLSVSEKPVFAVAFSSDGHTLVSTSQAQVAVWNIAQQFPISHQIQTPEHVEAGPVISADGRALAYIDEYGQIILADATTGRILNDSIGQRATAVAFSPDKKQFVTVGWNGLVEFWDCATGEELLPPQQTKFRLFSVAFSADGKTLAIGGDSVFLLWDVSERRWIAQVADQQKDRIWSVSFSPNGKVIAAGGNRSLGLWDAKTGSQVVAPFLTDPDFKWLVGCESPFAPDGKLLAYRRGDTGVTLWSVDSRRQVGSSLSSHTGTVFGLAFSPNGKILVSGGNDGKVVLWDVASRETLGKPLVGFGEKFMGLAFNPKTGELALLGDHALVKWNLDEAFWREAACRVANRNLSREEWSHLFPPGVPYHEICQTQ